MRFLRAAMAAVQAACDLQRVIRWARIGATVIATAAAVLLASFVAVAMGLI
jgi:hypothetical protein